MPNHVCSRCLKEFKTKSNYNRHINRKNQCNEAEITIKMLERKIHMTNVIQKFNNIQNMQIENTQNTQNTIINAFDDKNISHITTEIFTECLNRNMMCIPDLIDKVHFDPNVPENHNIFISDRNRNYAKLYDGQKWKNINGDDAANLLISSFEDLICNFIDNLHDTNPVLYDELIPIYEKIKDIDNNAIKNLSKEIKKILYDKKDIIKNTNKL